MDNDNNGKQEEGGWSMDGKKEMDERGGNRKGGAGEWKSVIIALIAGITAIVCVVIFQGALWTIKRPPEPAG